MQLRRRCLVFPAQAEVPGKTGSGSPVIFGVEIPSVGAQVFVGVAEGNCGRIRPAQQKTGKVGSGEGKYPPRILLLQEVKLLAKEAPPKLRLCGLRLQTISPWPFPFDRDERWRPHRLAT